MSEPLNGRELLAIRARTMRAADGHHQSLTRTEADRAALLDDVYRLRTERLALTSAIRHVREWHHPMPVYIGEPGCLEGGGCVHGEDYPDSEEGPRGGFCPHTSKVAVICFACSYQDTEGEGGAWPRWGWVLHVNCATIARLDHPTDTTEETDRV